MGSTAARLVNRTRFRDRFHGTSDPDVLNSCMPCVNVHWILMALRLLERLLLSTQYHEGT